MKKYLFLFITLTVLTACNDKSGYDQAEEKVWVYFDYGTKEELNSYGVYGEITQKDLEFIKLSSTSKRLVTVQNIRFIDNDSIIKDLSVNSNQEGTQLYQIKGINYLEILKKDPLNIKTDFYVD